MMHFAWPWMLILLPLPWFSSRFLPAAQPRGGALFLPFAAALPDGVAPAPLRRPRTRAILLALVWLLLVGAAMRPQWLGQPEEIPSTGRRLLLAVDTSGSMASQDMAGGYTRLQVVQAVAGEFIRHRQGDQVGLELFGTRPYMQAPLTADLDTVGQFLRESTIGMAGPQTAIGDAIGLALKRLDDARGQPAQRGANGANGEMVLVLLTDGGNNAGLMDPLQAAKMAAEAGLRIYTIGVGADGEDGGGANGDLDEDTLRSIATATGGKYFRATDADALHQVYGQIDKLEPGAGNAQWYRPSSEWFFWPLALALLLSVPAVLIRGRT